MYGDLGGTGPYTTTRLPVHVIGQEHHSDAPQSTPVGKLSRGGVTVPDRLAPCCLVQRQHDHLAHPARDSHPTACLCSRRPRECLCFAYLLERNLADAHRGVELTLNEGEQNRSMGIRSAPPLRSSLASLQFSRGSPYCFYSTYQVLYSSLASRDTYLP